MDENSQFGKMLVWGLGVIGLGAVASAVFLPFPIGIVVALSVVLLALLLFGGFFLWRRLRARREREQFSSAIEAQTAATPKAISDPRQRADLDRVRQKFQTGLQEFKSRGKDIYKLPWYVIIGESGSGKTEAIRHSGIDFPPGLQDELQGSGGTVNMDWWFTNRGIILDTAGSMLFNDSRAGEAPEWREFLRLLKRARPHCPINGLFLVLSVESLIRDSADTIAQKASRLAQQLDLIQRALDVRFPVYLLVTKCDLLTGFREFFDNIEDPLLQHQMFGWSNPDPLDSHFRPDLVEAHLRTVSARLRRRRMAFIREISGTGRLGDTSQFFAATYQLGRGPTTQNRRLDEVDALFALPESVMRLAPRLRRYLETVFVAGEWSAKPVFLRGIYFTSSMREGKALDEAIALATGLSLDQLPEERSWEKNRAFFLRDLFHDKVFRESGLVTRATNTLKLLRQRQFAIFGTAGAALLLLLTFSAFAYRGLKRSVMAEATALHPAAKSFANGPWSPAVVGASPIEGARYGYTATNLVADTDKSLVQYHKELKQTVDKPLEVGLIFRPLVWLGVGNVKEGPPRAQRLAFELSVLRPLIAQTRKKMQTIEPPAGSPAALLRHRDALTSLLELEGDALKGNVSPDPVLAARYLKNFLSYLTEDNRTPDTALVDILVRTYSPESLKQNHGEWPPRNLLGGNTLAGNPAIKIGLENFHKSSITAQTNNTQSLKLLDDLTDKLISYQRQEALWLTNTPDLCAALDQALAPAKTKLDASWKTLDSFTNFPVGSYSNLSARYDSLSAAKANASAKALSDPLNRMLLKVPDPSRGLLREVKDLVDQLASQAANDVLLSFNNNRSAILFLDANFLAPMTNSAVPSFQMRWSLITNACALASAQVKPNETIIGDKWTQFDSLKRDADQFRTRVTGYNGPFAETVTNSCTRIARNAEQTLQAQYVDDYINVASKKLSSLTLTSPPEWTTKALTNAAGWLARLSGDLQTDACNKLGPQADKLAPVRKLIADSQPTVLSGFDAGLRVRPGFPVVLDSSTPRSLSQLGELRKDLNAATATLLDPVWQPADSPALLKVRKDCKSAADVVNALVKDDGSPAEWQLFFVPPADSAPEDDRVIITVFRMAQVTSRNINTSLPDLTKADITRDDTCFLAKLPADAPLSISFRHSGEDAKSEPGPAYSDWGLARVIRAGKAARSEDGTRWKFKVPLSDGTRSGSVTFEARLEPKQPPLPKPEDWLTTK